MLSLSPALLPAMSGRITAAGTTLRSRIPINPVSGTLTLAARASIHNPTGTNRRMVNRMMMARNTSMKKTAGPN